MGQSQPYGDRSILIVEDQYIIRMELMDFFREEGFRVLEADTADQAINILAHDVGVRVVLTDMELHGEMTGLELAHMVRTRHPPTTLFVMSTRQAPDQSALPTRTTFVSKPLDRQHLLRQIEPVTPN
ncbi:response regulator [Brevundimonas sp. PAMC22021]|uniref:response regulator n=1 Tax=Brevundimonas sp. PAMC22021 TaxID=2861285 RepID=UPI001C637129|nr:response regulator [Brevundimonas sp. PAMC22021]QYF87014.1 response regulator [Brevundimonas sp. PAMC22021]